MYAVCMYTTSVHTVHCTAIVQINFSCTHKVNSLCCILYQSITPAFKKVQPKKSSEVFPEHNWRETYRM